jgi:uncharacterized repeat protein (TIGR01451 family)
VAGTCSGVERRGGTVQTLYLTKTVTIQGGYDVMDGLAGPPDPATYTTTLHASSQGGVVVISGDVNPTLEGLHITGGAPITDSVGGGIHIVTATATISGCRVYSNTAENNGGGVYLENSDSILINNIISDNSANLFGGGIYLQNSDARFINNVIQSNVGGEGGGGLYVIDGSFVMTNTVLATNQANNGGGLYVDGSNTQLEMLHTTIAENDATESVFFGDGIYVEDGNVVMVNTIVANHDRGIYLDGGSVEMEYTLWWPTTDGPTGNITSDNDFWGDPLFVDAPAGDYHIQPGSAAVGGGIPAGVDFDLDGHPRGSNPDIGAYESPYGVAVAKVSSSSIVEPGATLTYTIYVTNTGYMTLTGLVLTDTLPSGDIDPSGVLTWTLGSLPAGDTWSPPPEVVVHVSSTYTGVLTNTVTVSASQLVTASADIQVTVSANAGNLPWVEDFEDLPDGTIHDAGSTAWSIRGVVPGPWVEFSVQSHEFDSSNTDREGVWISGEIDISGADSVDVSIDLRGAGGLNDSGGWKKEDYLRVYYKLDGGDAVEIVDIAGWCDGSLCIHEQTWTTVGLSGLSGDRIQIIIRTKTTADDEHYYWDNVKVYETPSISINSTSVLTEGNTSTQSMVFTVSLSSASSFTVTVDYATADGTATDPEDYTAISDTLTFLPGQTTQTITVTVNGDTKFEPNEHFYVNLANPFRATISDAQGEGRILNDDSQPHVSIGDASVTEGDSGIVDMAFVVTLTNPSYLTVSVTYSTTNGTAVAPNDYTAVSTTTLTFSPGQTTQTITITVNGDTAIEPDEVFYVDLDNPPPDVTIDDDQGEGTILNDDLPSISINSTSVLTEGNTSTQSMVFTVSLSSASSFTVTVDYATADGTATDPEDYTAISDTLTFSPGQTTQTITVTVNGDTKFELDESFYVNLDNPSGATIGNGQGEGRILNDDSQPLVSINSISMTEGVSGTTSPMVFTVTLTNPSYLTVSVTYSTTNGTAVAPDDYMAVSTTTLTFSPGQTTQTITITVYGDTAIEPDEVFYVDLDNPPPGVTIDDDRGEGWILDDDS